MAKCFKIKTSIETTTAIKLVLIAFSHQKTIRSWNGVTEYSGKVERLIPVDESPPQTRTETQCSSAAAKVKQFVMVKIGKTGTTTMRSIFVRFASRNRLSCLNPAAGRFVNWRKQKG